MQLKDFLPQFTPWAELREAQRSFFVGDEYLPLPEAHATRIFRLHGIAAVEFIRRALYKVPSYSIAATGDFKFVEQCFIEKLWDEKGIAQVRGWLFNTGVPFSTPVYLLYHEEVIATEWKILVRYWDAFACNVGVAMVVVDNSKSWACEFDHNDVITFMRY